MTPTNLFRSNADCILYTYGVGASETQGTPPYMLELARKNRTKMYELIHFDHVFATKTCLNQRDWAPISSAHHVTQYRSTQFANLHAKLIPESFRGWDGSFRLPFIEALRERLDRGSEIFLGVHNACWTDMHGRMGETYNELQGQYPGRIHFYIQASRVPAFVFKGLYHPLFGLSANEIECPEEWAAFRRVFSSSPASREDVQKVKEVFLRFLSQMKQNPNSYEGRELDRFLAHNDCSEKLFDHRLIVIPLEQLTAQMWEAEPGEEIMPQDAFLHDRWLDQLQNHKKQALIQIYTGILTAIGVASFYAIRFARKS